MTFADLRNVDWWATVKLALARGFFSSLVIILFSRPPDWIGFVIGWTLGGTVFAYGTVLVLRILDSIRRTIMPGSEIAQVFVGLVGWGALILSIGVALGDPIIYVITRVAPSVFNVANFRFFNLAPMIFVMRGAQSIELGFKLPSSWTGGEFR